MVERVIERIVEKVIKVPTREKLPRNRTSHTFEFRVADCKGFVTVGEFDDGRPGEIFLRISKQGSTLAGIMDAFAISVSYGLQYGVPLRVYVETLTNTRFEPAGMTDDPELRIASSILDYIFRRLAVDYLSFEERAELEHPHHRRAHAAHAARRRGGRSPRPARAARSPPTRPASTPRRRCWPTLRRPKELSLLERAGVTDPPRRSRTRTSRSPRPPTPMPRTACSAASRCSGPARCHACPSCGSTSGCS